MINGFTDAEVIGAMAGFIVASYLAFFGWLVSNLRELRKDMHALSRETRQDLSSRIDALDSKLTAKIDAVDNRLGARIDAVDTKLSAKLDALTIAVSRLEGAVYHGLPEPRRAVSEQ
jgi:hypothetical protein